MVAADFIPTSEWAWDVMVYIIVHVIFQVALTIQRWWACKAAASEVTDAESPTPAAKSDLRGRTVRILMVCIYVAFVWFYSVTIAVYLGIADVGKESWFDQKS